MYKPSKNYKTVELQRLVVTRFHSNKPKARLFNKLLVNTSVLFSGNITLGNTRTSYLQVLEVKKCKFFYHSKWFEPRSISSSYSVIVRVSVVLKRTVVGD